MSRTKFMKYMLGGFVVSTAVLMAWVEWVLRRSETSAQARDTSWGRVR